MTVVVKQISGPCNLFSIANSVSVLIIQECQVNVSI